MCAAPREGARSGPFFVSILKIPEVFMAGRATAIAGVVACAEAALRNNDAVDSIRDTARLVRRPNDVQRIAYTLSQATAASGISRSGLYRLIGEGSCRCGKLQAGPCSLRRSCTAHYFGADRADPRCGVVRGRWRLIVANDWSMQVMADGRTPQFQRRRLVRSGCGV